MIRRISKKIGILLLVGILGISPFNVSAAQIDNGTSYPVESNTINGWPQGPDLYSETAVLMDADTGAILYNKGMDEKRYPASITKIMTALLALEHTSLDDSVTFSEECLADQTLDSGNIGMQVGEVLTMRQCLLALMIQSANDVATQIAVHVSGSVAAFADLMNQKAQELGCSNTHFVNASGMPDENHYTTAHDMALIFQEAIKNQDFLEIIGTQSFTIDPTNKNTESRTYSTHHALVAQSAPEYYEGCFGGKTGVTVASRNTLVSGAVREGMTLIAVAMRADSGQVCQDHINLFNYGFENFQKVEVPGGAVTIPKTMQVENLTMEEDYSYYYESSYFVGKGAEVVEEVVPEEPQTLPAEEMPEKRTPINEESVVDLSVKKNSVAEILIYILTGMIVITLIITIVSAVKKKKKKKAKKNK